MSSRCPICNSNNIDWESTGGPSFKIRCRKCGCFLISEPTLSKLGPCNLTERNRAVASYEIRKMQEKTTCPSIEFEQIEKIIEKDFLPSPEVMKQNLIVFLGGYSLGKNVVITYQEHSSIVGTENDKALHFIIKELIQKGYVATFESDNEIALTLDGWEEYQKIISKINSPKDTGTSQNDSKRRIRTKKQKIEKVISDIRQFRFCGPSDDPDEQTSVIVGFRYLIIQLKRLAGPLLPPDLNKRLDAIEVEFGDLFSTYDAKAEIDALLPDIDPLLFSDDYEMLNTTSTGWFIETTIITNLGSMKNSYLDSSLLIRLCEEINSCYSHGNLIATCLLMRAVLNYIPPVFGQKSFSQVVASMNRSLKENFKHLEDGLRKIADFHTHRTIRKSDKYPSCAQLDPYKPQFELLLQEVISRMEQS